MVDAVSSIAAAEGELSLEFKKAYVLITCRGRLPTLSVAQTLQRRIESELRKQPRDLALFDNRSTDTPPDDVRESMWDWVTDTFDRTSLVLESEMLCVRANMNALVRGVRVRAFSSKILAASWLLQV